MIEKFNFFDVYAYLLPGMSLLGSIWLPFGIVAAKWPAPDFSSALLSLVAAYIVGHVLYYPAKEALPTEDWGWYGKDPPAWRINNPSHASDFILDAQETTFLREFKASLGELINDRFKGPVQVHVGFDWNGTDKTKNEAESKQRDMAFFLCRSALVTGKVASYGEQFEGLYQLLRCLTVVFALALYYHVGWALAVLNTSGGQGLQPVALAAALALVCAAILDKWGAKILDKRGRKNLVRAVGFLRVWEPQNVLRAVRILGKGQVKHVDRKRLKAEMTIGLLMLALLLCPFFLDCFVHLEKAHESCNKGLLLAGLALSDALVALRCSSAYRRFAKEFAKAIYLDFYVYATGQNKAHAEAE